MDTARVNDAGLQLWAAQYQTATTQLASRAASAAGGPAGQRTAAAARAADAGVDATVGALTTRLHATGAKVSGAATRYVGADLNSARRIAAVSIPPVV
ncbi:MAG: hypothetical protein K0U84_08115 [Actinomycetia bacterium]|nr:hypothetical protein [Actinomycetes bacterium]